MDKKKIMWSLLSVLIAFFTIWAVVTQSKNFSKAEFLIFLEHADPGWICMAVLCMLGFVFFEGCALGCILRALGYHRGKGSTTLYSAANVYFSAITPSASGGQPASAFFMMRDSIPLTAVTVTLLVNLIMYHAALLVIGGATLLFRFDIFMDFSLVSKIFIGIGILVLSGLGAFFYLALRNERLIYLAGVKCLEILERLHLCHNREKKQEKLRQTLKEYAICSEIVSGQKRLLLKVFFWNLCQRISQFGVSFMAAKGLGYSLKTAGEIWLVQSCVSIGSNCVPIPGSMGVADYLMMDGFTAIIGSEKAAYMELFCRSISFYGCIMVSAVIVLLGYWHGKRKRGKHERKSHLV